MPKLPVDAIDLINTKMTGQQSKQIESSDDEAPVISNNNSAESSAPEMSSGNSYFENSNTNERLTSSLSFATQNNNNVGERKMTSILDLNLMSSYAGSGNTDIEKIKDIISKTIEENKLEDRIKAKIRTILVSNDREYPNIGTLFLSTILVTAVTDGIGLSFPVVFPQSQNERSTVQSIMDYDAKIRQELVNSRSTNFTKQKNFYTPDIVVDKRFKEICKQHVSRELGGDVKVFLFPPFVVSENESIKTEEQRNVIASKILMAAFNTIYTHLSVTIRKTAKDVSVSNLFTDGRKFQLELNIHGPDYKAMDLAGNVNRANFQIVGTSTTGKQETDTSWNQSGQNDKLTVTSGYMDAIPFTHHKQQGFENVKCVRLMPHIIVTDIFMNTPTLNMYLLGLLNSTLLIDKSASLMVFKNNIKTQNDPSSLDNIVALGNEIFGGQQKNKDVKIDLRDKNLSDETINNILKEMFLGKPVLSLDIIPYTSTTNCNYTILRAATSQPGSDDQKNAINDIVSSADVLTNGIFSKLFNPNGVMIGWNDIFNKVRYFPAGYYYKGSEIHDLREIDLSVLAKECTGAKAGYVYRWCEADNIPNREECIMEKLDILNKGIELTNNTFITSRGYRITFSSKFIRVLMEAANQAGLDFEYKANTLDLRGNNGYEHMADVYGSAMFDANTPLIRNTGFGNGKRFGGYGSSFGLF